MKRADAGFRRAKALVVDATGSCGATLGQTGWCARAASKKTVARALRSLDDRESPGRDEIAGLELEEIQTSRHAAGLPPQPVCPTGQCAIQQLGHLTTGEVEDAQPGVCLAWQVE